MRKIFAADIGGTSSRFGAFEASEGGGLVRRDSHWLFTGGAASFEELMEQIGESPLSLKPRESDLTVIAVAGPVEGGTYSSPPNIPWDIDISSRGPVSFPKALLINDFFAQAFAAKSPVAADALPVLPGEAVAEAPLAVMGAGTGLGHAALLPDGKGGYLALPSEKGHAAFPLNAGREGEYQAFLRSETGEAYPRGDTVVSGRGMALLHRFLTGQDLSPEEVTVTLTPPSETLSWFARFYGRACRDYALTVLARGGVYLAGGLAARTPAMVRHEAFAAEFRSSPTMGGLLSAMPVFLIIDQESGLWGAARYGMEVLFQG